MFYLNTYQMFNFLSFKVVNIQTSHIFVQIIVLKKVRNGAQAIYRISKKPVRFEITADKHRNKLPLKGEKLVQWLLFLFYLYECYIKIAYYLSSF
jgi:hypothetical protein